MYNLISVQNALLTCPRGHDIAAKLFISRNNLIGYYFALCRPPHTAALQVAPSHLTTPHILMYYCRCQDVGVNKCLPLLHVFCILTSVTSETHATLKLVQTHPAWCNKWCPVSEECGEDGTYRLALLWIVVTTNCFEAFEFLLCLHQQSA